MKKLFLTTAALVLLSTASFADQNTENENKMMEMRHSFMVMTDQMMDSQMEMLKQQEAMLSNYKKLLKQMMENDMGSHN
jgi:hypothetical protein